MKTILTTLSLALITGLALGATEPLPSVVEQGLFEEEVNRDFDAAIAAYESAVEQFDRDREYAATAIFRLAENHRRAGRTDEAVPLYERIVREFHDYPELVEAAAGRLPEDRLAALGVAEAPVDEEEREIERLKELFRESPDLLYSIDSQREPSLGSAPPGNTRLHEAIENGYLKVAELLIDQGLSLTVRNRRGYTPLHFAVQQGSRAAVELLLRKGADVMVRMVRVTSSGWQDGWTPLHLAAYSGYAAIAEVLVEESAEVNAASANGITPLLLAAAGDHIQSEQIVRFLLDHDADVNAASVNGWTALYAAAQTENFEVAQLLLEHGADVNVVYEDGATPLHRAVENTNVRMIELFLEHGAEVNALNKRGQTPLDYLPEDAPNTIAQEISELLRQHGATEGKNHAVIVTPDEQEQFVLLDRSETMTLPRALIEAGINVDENPRISVSRPGGRIHINITPYREILQREGEDVKVESGSEIKLHAR